MARQTIITSIWQDQLIRGIQRIVYSVNLGVSMCMLMILIFPVELETEYDVSIITLLRLNFWVMVVCCSVSLNCAGAVSAFLRIHYGSRVCSVLRVPVVLGTMYLSLVPTLAGIIALLDKPVSLRGNLTFCVLLWFFVMVLYRFVEHSEYAYVQRVKFIRWW